MVVSCNLQKFRLSPVKISMILLDLRESYLFSLNGFECSYYLISNNRISVILSMYDFAVHGVLVSLALCQLIVCSSVIIASIQ